jgi:hypothetical protein
MLVKIGTAIVLAAAFMAAAAVSAPAQNAGGVTRANGSYVPSRGRPPRQTVQPQQEEGSSAFQPPPNNFGQPMSDTVSKPFSRTVGSPYGR